MKMNDYSLGDRKASYNNIRDAAIPYDQKKQYL